METGRPIHIKSLLYLILSISGFFLTLTAGGFTLLAGLFSAVSGETNDILYPSFIAGWVLILISLLLIPGVVYAIYRLRGRPAPVFRFSGTKLLPFALLGLWLPILVLGSVISGKTNYDWLVLPLLTIFLIAIPLWVWMRMGTHPGTANNSQAIWSLFGVNLLVTPVLIMFFEIIALGMIGLVVMGIIAMSPSLINQVETLIQQITYSGMDPILLMRVVKPILQNPWVLFGIFTTASVIIPIVEELLKPVWLWMFIRNLNPATGFKYGLLSGAAFALIESMGYLAAPMGEGWTGLIIGRVGTGVLHMAASGIMGWGLASAWHEHKYLRLAKAFLFSVFIHGLWNAIGLLMGMAEFLEPVNQLNLILIRIGTIAPFALIVLTVCLLALLLIARRNLKPQVSSEGSEVRI